MTNYKLKYEDLLAIAHNTRLLLGQLGVQGDLLSSEQHLKDICTEIEVTELTKRNITIVK